MDECMYNSQHLKVIKKDHQSCPKTKTGIVQNSCIILMKGFDPLQTLTTEHSVVSYP